MKSLVLVLGAGASKEVSLPIGTELKSDIGRLLDIRFEHGLRQASGDYKIAEALRLIASKEKEQTRNINPFVHMCWRIRDAMPQAISIDNFIDCHADEPKIAVCGKLAIARAILAAEGKSTLTINGRNIHNKLDFARNAKTWFNSFFQLLTENCRAEDLPARLRSVGVITFNYDRCFEHYLFNAIQNYYGSSADKSAELLTNLEVHHPYGMVGSLPWMRRQASIDFGADIHVNELVTVSQQLRTFTEGTDPTVSDIDSIRATVADTKRLVFLGFAFHRLNMELLFGTSGSSMKKTTQGVFGSAFGISPSDCKVVADELSSHTGLNIGPIQLRNDLTCATLVQEYWRSLSLV
ncbi:hypothetical protein [Sulfuritalea sp.]|uniref:hypothetical protein n=1 Tax=Sulfuritalea sp. TaxID=2480090 RepID=UPI001AD38ADF|nr:hypothetical protein [Sulfuritalea sp.]MBN8476307.1 hypothetical protein [Sulfuritalea sp.]